MKLPNHLAIIMDGNGRWAKERGKPRFFGHVKGVSRVSEVVESCARLKIPYLTLYAFSMENWLRPKDEVSLLMKLLIKFLKQETANLMRQNIRLESIGDLSHLPSVAKQVLLETVERTSENTGMVLTLALSYGGRQEITQAVKALAKDLHCDKISEDKIDESLLASYLQTSSLPDPDIILRTSGESRLSNFLLWQAAYAEIIVVKKAWPDFVSADLLEVLQEYSRRERRFGKTSEQVGDVRELN